MTVLSIWTTLETIRDRVLTEQLGDIANVAGIIACIMAGISIVSLTRDYIKGMDLDAWELLRPIIIMLLTCNFNQAVLGPVNSVTNIATGKLVEVTSMSDGEYIVEWAKNINQIQINSALASGVEYIEELEEINKDNSWISRAFSKIWLAIRKVLKVFFGVHTMTFAGIIGGVLFILVKLLLFIQQILCSVYLLMNALIGPIILALCIMPGFESGFRHWLARYIQIAMWVPTGYFLLAINLWISKECSDYAHMKEIGLGIEWLMISLQLCALIGIAAVPKISAWVIESSGANDAHGSMSNPARMLARKALKM